MGPTGAGKTGIAIKIAKKFPSVIINADSRQIYRDFPIISAQPSSEEQAVCPHKLYGYLDIEEQTTAVAWVDLAKKEIIKAHEQNLIPILVGGTGFYFKTLLDGITEIPDIPEEIHNKYIVKLQELGSLELYKKLMTVDPDYGNKIHFNDKQRIARALEVYEATGQTFSKWHQQGLIKPDFEALRLGIGIELKELTPILYERIKIMLKEGALEEAENAFAKNSNLDACAWTGIGCREIAKYLIGEYDLEKCIELWGKNTRAYAKRQWTWFRADKNISWFHPYEFNMVSIENFLAQAEKI